MFDAEVFTVYQALRISEDHQEAGSFTASVDSTAAINRLRSGQPGPGQRFAIVAIEVAQRIRDRGGEVTIRWASPHAGAEGNETADRFAKVAAQGKGGTTTTTDDRLQLEAGLAHLTRKATEKRTKAASAWIRDRLRASRRYRPSKGRGLRRKDLRRARKSTAGRYY